MYVLDLVKSKEKRENYICYSHECVFSLQCIYIFTLFLAM